MTTDFDTALNKAEAVGLKVRRPRGTSEKAVANATLSAVQKIYPVLVALDAEQRKRALSAVAVLLDDGTP